MDGSRLMSLRYDGHCARCNASVRRGERAYYDSVTKKVHCRGCGDAARAPLRPSRVGAGASARREYERRRDGREARIRAAVPLVGGVLAQLTEPQHQIAWARGAEGERKAATALEKRCAVRGVVLLHDRHKPGSRANVDHIAVGPGGVTVIDTKRLKGPIRVASRGFLRPKPELRVAGRDRTKLVTGVLAQLEVVRSVLDASDFVRIDLRGALQFVDGDLPLFGLQPIQGVTLGAPRRISKLAAREGRWTPSQVRNIAATLDRLLPAA